MKIHIVLPAALRAWIIEKAADRLVEHVGAYGAEVTVGENPNPAVDLNHWMSYAFANVKQATPSTMLITHPDDPYKSRLIRETLARNVDVGICMSNEIVGQLVAAGAPRTQLCYVLLGHDGAVIPRRVTIGITTRIYADGRKREQFLRRLADEIDLSAFKFKIFGAGWDSIVNQLRRAGADVEFDGGSENYKVDYQRIVHAVPSFDYYLYLGMDEGSLGTLDALAAGVGTIVTDQGFHKDIAHVLSHRFVEYGDLLRIFLEIQAGRADRIKAAAQFTWQEYARRHVLIWNLVLAGNRKEIATQLANELTDGSALRVPSIRYRLRVFEPVRILSAASHIAALKPVVDLVRRWRRRQ